MDLLSSWEEDWTSENQAGPRRCGARSNGSGAGRGAGSSCTSGHASLARRRLAFDCFQLLQNFLPWRRSRSCLGRAPSRSEA